MSHLYEEPPYSDFEDIPSESKLKWRLLGLGLIFIGVFIGVALAFYNDRDPTTIAANSEIVTNKLGVVGAELAGQLEVRLGALASWCVSLLFLIWGVRCAVGIAFTHAVRKVVTGILAIITVAILSAAIRIPVDAFGSASAYSLQYARSFARYHAWGGQIGIAGGLCLRDGLAQLLGGFGYFVALAVLIPLLLLLVNLAFGVSAQERRTGLEFIARSAHWIAYYAGRFAINSRDFLKNRLSAYLEKRRLKREAQYQAHSREHGESAEEPETHTDEEYGEQESHLSGLARFNPINPTNKITDKIKAIIGSRGYFIYRVRDALHRRFGHQEAHDDYQEKEFVEPDFLNTRNSETTERAPEPQPIPVAERLTERHVEQPQNPVPPEPARKIYNLAEIDDPDFVDWDDGIPQISPRKKEISTVRETPAREIPQASIENPPVPKPEPQFQQVPSTARETAETYEEPEDSWAQDAFKEVTENCDKEPLAESSAYDDFDYRDEYREKPSPVLTPAAETKPEIKPLPPEQPPQPKSEAGPESQSDRDKKASIIARAQYLNQYSKAWQLPPVSLLAPKSEHTQSPVSQQDLHEMANKLNRSLDDYQIRGQVIKAHAGPVVTLYEVQLERGEKKSKLVNASVDISRDLEIEGVIRVRDLDGKSTLGVEVPNEVRQTIGFSQLISSPEWREDRSKLPLILGVDVMGKPVVADLAGMPHLLVAGATGAGKSVAVNAMLLSLLYRLSPEQCQFILIDPKTVELAVYDDIPHLLVPVINDPSKVLGALNWAVTEMERRYQALKEHHVRNLAGYNQSVRDIQAGRKPSRKEVRSGFDDMGAPLMEEIELPLDEMSYIVIVIDEWADLYLTEGVGKKIEVLVNRLAAKARAAGIHIILATQRPSTDVLSGTIRNNFPARIAFRVSGPVDSRIILDTAGAESLLGKGDMLYKKDAFSIPRLQGAFLSDEEVENVTQYLRDQRPPFYDSEIEAQMSAADEDNSGERKSDYLIQKSEEEDSIYQEAVEFAISNNGISTSRLQRRFGLGYNRAANLIERMEDEKIIGPQNGSKPRQILKSAPPQDDFDA